MSRSKKVPLCPLHFKKLPCLSCRGIKGGSVSSPRKSEANRKKARDAALKRWGRLPLKEDDAFQCECGEHRGLALRKGSLNWTRQSFVDTCPRCGAIHEITSGRIKLIKAGNS
jgi:hypothetical protein